MTESEMKKVCIEEFSRLQKYMLLLDDVQSPAYKEMFARYEELKVILECFGVNLITLDKIQSNGSAC